MRINNNEISKEEVILDNEQIDLTGLKVLLVEDNEINRETATELLEERGITVSYAEDGDIAVEKVKKSNDGDYDVILLDIQMPRMSGYDATRAIRSLENPHLSSIPIIAMTANAFEEDKQNAINAGMNDHIAKPIDVGKLFSVIASYVKK